MSFCGGWSMLGLVLVLASIALIFLLGGVKHEISPEKPKNSEKRGINTEKWVLDIWKYQRRSRLIPQKVKNIFFNICSSVSAIFLYIFMSFFLFSYFDFILKSSGEKNTFFSFQQLEFNVRYLQTAQKNQIQIKQTWKFA